VSRRDYIESPKGWLSLYHRRARRRMLLRVDGIEPRSKGAMPVADRLTLQQEVLTWLRANRRQAFRGPVVLRLKLCTTAATPPHAHTLAKCILDLLGAPIPGTDTRRRGLVYQDDGQIHGLSVMCEHGAAAPRIAVEAQSLADFIEDVAVAAQADGHRTGRRGGDDQSLAGAAERIGELRADEAWHRATFGDEAYETELRLARWEYQRAVLGFEMLRPRDLALLFGHLHPNIPVRAGHDRDLANVMRALFGDRLFRMRLDQLPLKRGGGADYRAAVETALEAFLERWRGALTPLCAPVALEVVVKPPPAATHHLFDLDNVVRNYLVPVATKVLAPPSHYMWALGSRTPAEAGRMPPASTKVGLVRFEAWRAPRVPGDTSPGFVSVALVADDHGLVDSITRVRSAVETLDD
jgi:hypothetical protein